MILRFPLALTLSALLGSTAVLVPLVSNAAESGPAAEATSAHSVVPSKAPDATLSDASKADAGTSRASDAGKAPSADIKAPSTDMEKAPASASSTAPQPKDVGSKPTKSEMRAQRQRDREAFFSAHLAALHAGLLLKPDQQSLWQPVESAIRDLSKVRSERWEMRHGDMSSGAAGDGEGAGQSASAGQESDSLDRLLARGENLTKMGNAIQSLAKSTAPLLASLTPEQKDRLPALLEGLKPRRLLARAFNVGDEHEGMDESYGYRQDREDTSAPGGTPGASGGMTYGREGGHGSMRYNSDGRGDRFQSYQNNERKFRQREQDDFGQADRSNGERSFPYRSDGDDS